VPALSIGGNASVVATLQREVFLLRWQRVFFGARALPKPISFVASPLTPALLRGSGKAHRVMRQRVSPSNASGVAVRSWFGARSSVTKA
jgi:hypothetical protein